MDHWKLILNLLSDSCFKKSHQRHLKYENIDCSVTLFDYYGDQLSLSHNHTSVVTRLVWWSLFEASAGIQSDLNKKNLLFNKTVQNNPGPGITKKSRKWWLDNLHFVGPPLLDMLMGSWIINQVLSSKNLLVYSWCVCRMSSCCF